MLNSQDVETNQRNESRRKQNRVEKPVTCKDLIGMIINGNVLQVPEIM